MQVYLFDMKNMEHLCDDFEEEILNEFFESGQSKKASDEQYFYTPIFRQLFNPIKHGIDVSSLFNIKVIQINEEFLKDKIHTLEGLPALSLDIFKKSVSDIKTAFTYAREEIDHLCSILDKIETERINEAIHDFFEECYYSSVAMSVCAIESRFLKLMSSIRPEEKEKLEAMTLGQLIREYIENKEQYNSIIPKKHEPLLDLCNTYRIFSVHPKKGEINKNKANAILIHSIEFLTDEETQVAQEISAV